MEKSKTAFAQVEEKKRTIEKYENELQEKNELVQQLKNTLSESDENHEEKLKQAKDEFNHKMATLEQQLEEFKQVIPKPKFFSSTKIKEKRLSLSAIALKNDFVRCLFHRVPIWLKKL